MSEKTRYQTLVFKGEPNEDFKLQGLTVGGIKMKRFLNEQDRAADLHADTHF